MITRKFISFYKTYFVLIINYLYTIFVLWKYLLDKRIGIIISYRFRMKKYTLHLYIKFLLLGAKRMADKKHINLTLPVILHTTQIIVCGGVERRIFFSKSAYSLLYP